MRFLPVLVAALALAPVFAKPVPPAPENADLRSTGDVSTVTFRPEGWSAVEWRPATPWSQGPTRSLRVPLQMDERHSAKLAVLLFGEDGEVRAFGERFFPAGSKGTLVMHLENPVNAWGVQKFPERNGTFELQYFSNQRPASPIARVALYVPGTSSQPRVPLTITLGALEEHDGPPVPSPWVDRFGQSMLADWQGKIQTDADLRSSRTEPEPPVKGAFDAYGGWTGAFRGRATGRFRTEQRDGRWWLITPEGHPFFSLGVNWIMPARQSGIEGRKRTPTAIASRQEWFAELPPRDGELGGFYGNLGFGSGPWTDGLCFDFYRANLFRMDGPEWLPRWHDRVAARLRAWGFNTIANWSDRELYHREGLVFTATAYLEGLGGAHPELPNVFSADFPRHVRDTLDRQIAADLRGNPRCLGVFVDNELPWSFPDDRNEAKPAWDALAGKLGAESRAALLDLLSERHGSIEKLNAAWGTEFADWTALESAWTPPHAMPTAMQDDFLAFAERFAERYFRTVRDAVRAIDPEALYLGCRFHAEPRPVIERVAARHVDVMSFNIYRREPAPERQAGWATYGRPVMITEWSIAGRSERGVPGEGFAPPGATPAERAKLIRDYILTAARNPLVVGLHWFCYQDEAVTGRTSDGENHAFGLVDITDQPYPEAVSALRETHASLPQELLGDR